MAVAQLNVRMDKSLKDEGDLALARAGYAPTQAIRSLWSFARRNAGDVSRLRELFRLIEGTDGEKEAEVEHRDASQEADKLRKNLYATLGISRAAPAVPTDPDERYALLQRQVDDDKSLLAEAYAERSAERGV